MSARTRASTKRVPEVPAKASTSGSERVPTNLSLPRGLVAELDEVAGPRGRSAFVEAAVRRALRRERLRTAIGRTAGVLRADDYPHWRTSADVVEWVRQLRAEVTDPGPDT